METQRIHQKRKMSERRSGYLIILFMGAFISMVVIVLAFILIANYKNNLIQTQKREVAVCTSAVSDKPLNPIIYEETFLYQEELERQRQQELQRQRLEELERQEEEAEQFLYLQKLTFAEAQGESMEGKILVAASVVNRKNHPTKFPNTIKEVVLEVVNGVPQYTDISYVCDEYIKEYSWRQEAWEECRIAVKRALAGEDPAAEFLGGPTLYFYNPNKISKVQEENRKGILMYINGEHNFHHNPPRED